MWDEDVDVRGLNETKRRTLADNMGRGEMWDVVVKMWSRFCDFVSESDQGFFFFLTAYSLYSVHIGLAIQSRQFLGVLKSKGNTSSLAGSSSSSSLSSSSRRSSAKSSAL
jgi:hypothetical protein